MASWGGAGHKHNSSAWGMIMVQVQVAWWIGQGQSGSKPAITLQGSRKIWDLGPVLYKTASFLPLGLKETQVSWTRTGF